MERLVPYALVAMATVADVVPLTFENRILVQRGIDSLRQSRNPGLRALMECSGLVPGEPLSCGDLGFRTVAAHQRRRTHG